MLDKPAELFKAEFPVETCKRSLAGLKNRVQLEPATKGSASNERPPSRLVHLQCKLDKLELGFSPQNHLWKVDEGLEFSVHHLFEITKENN